MDAAKHLHAATGIRADYLEKVTGEAKFASDIVVPGMLHGRILRSTLPHARIANLRMANHRSGGRPCTA